MAPLRYLSTLALSTISACLADAVNVGPGSSVARRPRHVQPAIEDVHFLPPAGSSRTTSDGGDDLELTDVVLVASVDGSFHALNRSTGHALWSMAEGVMDPLVRTTHIASEDDAEQYIIEPQSGDIYVISSPSAPLQRLPFSMSQLVDMSPFSFTGDEDKVFIGKKNTSLLVLEVETGRIKSKISSDACLWDAEPVDSFELDLDALESGEENGRSTPSEIFVGRTDYDITIHTRSRTSSSPRQPTQRLSFSVYGPNNQDLTLQSLYRRTPDDAYIQSLTNGQIISFKTTDADASDTAPRNQILWGHTFASPIVAVFDILRSPSRNNPFALLQPRSRLQDILPGVDLAAAARHNRFPNLESAYVGLLPGKDKDSAGGSLFAMSPDRFPLTVFSDANAPERPSTWRIDPPPGLRWEDEPERGRDLPLDVESVTRLRRLREMCKNGSMDPRCLTGVRPLESSSRSRLSRLLDGAPAPPSSPGAIDQERDREQTPLNTANGTGVSSGLPEATSSPVMSRAATLAGESAMVSTLVYLGLPFGAVTLMITALAIFLGAGWLFYSRKKTQASLTPVSSAPAVLQSSIESDKGPPVLAKTIDHSVYQTSTPMELPPTSSDGAKLTAEWEIVHSPALNSERSSSAADPTPHHVEAHEAKVVGEEESDKEADAAAVPGKKRVRRKARGGKKKKGNGINGINLDGAEEAEEAEKTPSAETPNPVDAPSISVPPTPMPSTQAQQLVVSEDVLGFGSHGTVVYRGSLQGRAVAVKRLLKDFVTLASREVGLLQESDDHPNVIRYYYQEAHGNFLYIALELCPASLADVIERPDQFRDISNAFNPKRALRQITAGLRHLHALKIVHRDIKPQNILISSAKKGVGLNAGYRMLISDFGLCRKLEFDQTSFLPTVHGAAAVGTVGWRAPEILRGEVSLEDASDENSQSSRSSVGTTTGVPTGKPTRLTKSVDIFALGCVFYYVLTNGGHPYGDRFERDVNIIRDEKSLNGLEHFGEEGSEAIDLIGSMLDPDAHARPDTTKCLLHPFFWDPARRLNFLQDASDRFEIMCRDPRDPMLVQLETDASSVVGYDWYARLDKAVIENLGKFRKYEGKSVQDLMRALRNKKHHYQDLPDHVKRIFGPMPEGYLAYFTRRFPRLFLHVHSIVEGSVLRHESMFKSYFELVEA
ncbi:hypothetical protein PUNSTDRAFT_80917 [Punctularia strigosozonata HHB-11173 SS5]|uniref:uncharacterized protein n=1 Tax=Punctularia strigosozonata (strain HHB-11173) TaxID=741275 RepID=UPI0004417513|nr:uncharacterized protein PUNSTDRAFT_80917 [Punctularia strigosozonata HHB-11173 SS5]EIN14494.1 hypothetical protein PUNSTDRAFT_80917 [Punctularia strigosozonata HHB-11173 SS5]